LLLLTISRDPTGVYFFFDNSKPLYSISKSVTLKTSIFAKKKTLKTSRDIKLGGRSFNQTEWLEKFAKVVKSISSSACKYANYKTTSTMLVRCYEEKQNAFKCVAIREEP
jgi:hypothetical protein